MRRLLTKLRESGAFKRWLAEGWSPQWIAYTVVSLALAVSGVAAFAAQHHLAGIVWLLAAVAVVAAWALIEMLRWRLKCNLLRADLAEAQATAREHEEIVRELRRELEGAREAQRPAVEAIVDGSGLEVKIDNEIRTAFPGRALILEIEFHVTNRDPMGHSLSCGLAGGPPFYPPDSNSQDPEYLRISRIHGEMYQRRSWESLPPHVDAGQTVRGVLVEDFGWDPFHDLPDYTLIVGDGRRQFRARPHGAPEAKTGSHRDS